MAFENIDVSSLKNSINSCINSLNFNGTTDLKSNLSDNVLQASSGGKLKDSLGSLVDIKYKNLKNYLKTCLSIADSISNYKELEKQNVALEKELQKLNNQLYTTKEVEEEYINAFGLTRTRKSTTKVIDENVQYRMLIIEKQIKENMAQMEQIESNVSERV